MSTTAQDLINQALQTLGVVGSGDTGSSEELNDGLKILNQHVESLSAQGLPIPVLSKQTINSIGAESYSLFQRPLAIRSVSVLVSSTSKAARIIYADEWAGIDRSRAGNFAEVAFYDAAYPSGSLSLSPKPAFGGTIELYCYLPLSTFAGLSTTIDLPAGYLRALHFGLAADLLPQYPMSKMADTIIALANDAKMSIQGLNAAVLGTPATAATAATPANAATMAGGGQ